MRKTNQKGIALIHSYEKCKLEAYLPTKNDRWTIGWGNTFYEDGSPVKQGDKITQERADKLFEIILAKFEKEVESVVKSKITDNQFAALMSFTYNIGTGNLKASTLLKKVNANPNDPSISLEFVKWNKQAGKVLNGLTKRRKEEAQLYFS